MRHSSQERAFWNAIRDGKAFTRVDLWYPHSLPHGWVIVTLRDYPFPFNDYYHTIYCPAFYPAEV